MIASFGAAIVCLGLAVLGMLVFTGTRFSTAWRRLRDFFTAADVEEDEEEVAEPEPVLQIGFDEPAPAEGLSGAPAARSPRPGRRPERRRRCCPRRRFPRRRPRSAFPTIREDLTEPDEAAPARRVGPDRTIETAQGPYQLPPIDLLREAPPSGADASDETQMREALERTLRTFGVDARVAGAHRGPTVTMYEVEVAAGTKVQQGPRRSSSDIAYALATPDVRISAPIPGRSAIGIEVPNKHRDFVMLGDILRSQRREGGDAPARGRRSARTSTAGRAW